MNYMVGRIIKAISGFYYVEAADDKKIYECKARGIFKKNKTSPLVGDLVYFTIIDEQNRKSIIEKILPRDTELIRPPIANVTQTVLVFGVINPSPNPQLIDRFIALAHWNRLKIVLCLNKIDLQKQNEYNTFVQIYKKIGYRVYETSTTQQINIDLLRDSLEEEITVFAGPSGVGKSSLLNSINPNLCLKTSSVSKKLKQGKHTTRYVQLIPFGKRGYMADTPGFTSLSIEEIPMEDLKECFIDFHEFDHECRFGYTCLHDEEPGCAVKEAVAKDLISKQRYMSYLQLLVERRNSKRM